MISLEFRRDLGVRKLESLSYRMTLFVWFSHLCRTPTCDRQTDTRWQHIPC